MLKKSWFAQTTVAEFGEPNTEFGIRHLATFHFLVEDAVFFGSLVDLGTIYVRSCRRQSDRGAKRRYVRFVHRDERGCNYEDLYSRNPNIIWLTNILVVWVLSAIWARLQRDCGRASYNVPECKGSSGGCLLQPSNWKKTEYSRLSCALLL